LRADQSGITVTGSVAWIRVVGISGGVDRQRSPTTRALTFEGANVCSITV